DGVRPLPARTRSGSELGLPLHGDRPGPLVQSTPAAQQGTWGRDTNRSTVTVPFRAAFSHEAGHHERYGFPRGAHHLAEQPIPVGVKIQRLGMGVSVGRRWRRGEGTNSVGASQTTTGSRGYLDGFAKRSA